MSGELDPNAMLFGGEEDGKTEEERAVEYVYGKNPNRVSALNDLWFDELLKKIESLDLPDEKAKIKMAFKLTAGAVLDMLADSQPPEAAPDVMSDFDIFMGVALTNKKFNVSLFEEQQKDLMQIDREKFHDAEEYARALSDFEDTWWEIGQPLLNGRNPNDAIKETLKKYGLHEERRPYPHPHPASSSYWANMPWSTANRPLPWPSTCASAYVSAAATVTRSPDRPPPHTT